ncbi:hypothetical protein [Novosphingobium sp.]|uniref:hypothetical protein n=1 Tax=Novosphingobium sp. TaxID=1874826 RepID=UPI001D378B91|nr:hypothetical protein [Novosphingobium sp.]MBX9664057.1 hypothetical protein [Novosphingobium sp.]
MALKQVLIAVGAVLMGLGLLDLARDGSLGSWAIAIAALLIAFATRGDAPKKGADNARG